MRLATRIFLAIAAVVTAVLGGALLATRARADRAADASVGQALAATGATVDDALRARSATLGQVMLRLVAVPAYVARLTEALRGEGPGGGRADLLDQADELRDQAGAAWTLVTDGDGVLRAWTAQREAFGEDFSGGALVARALGGDTTAGVWLEPDSAGDRLYQAVGVPIVDPAGGRVHGVVVAALPLDSAFAADLARRTGSAVALFTLDTTGRARVAAATLPAPALDTALAAVRLDSTADSAPRIQARTADAHWLGTLGALRTTDGTPVGGWAVLRSRDAELAAWAELRRGILWAFLVGLALALGASLLVARQLARPIQELAAAARRAREGDFALTIGNEARAHEGRDEIGELAGAFRRLLGDLREKGQLVDYLTLTRARPLREAVRAMAPAGASAGSGVIDGDGRLPEEGEVFAGRYRIERRLGAGGMGVVYRAWDERVDDVVALKALRTAGGGTAVDDEVALERFRQELRLARRITHRNVVRTYDLGESGGLHYITMEYVEGTSLAELLQREPRLPVPVVLTLARQLLRALDAAHEAGVVHRDIKPQNLVLDANGNLKVTDFGIARLAESERRAAHAAGRLTVSGAVLGTPRYMAPEQLMGESADQRTDLYAAGVVLHECLTGRPMFEAEGLLPLMGKHMHETPADPRVVFPDIPKKLVRVVMRALEKRPDDRWQSARAMLEALEDVKA